MIKDHNHDDCVVLPVLEVFFWQMAAFSLTVSKK